MKTLSVNGGRRQRAMRCLLAFALSIGASPAQGATPALTDDQRAVFELLDEFDSLDTSKLPFVVVVSTHEGRRWERFGFLESSDARQFRVRYVDLGRDTLEVRKETAGRVGQSFEPCDLRVAVGKAVERLKDRAENPNRLDYYMGPGQPMPPVVWMLFLARACARAGRVAEVNALWEALPEEYRSRERLTGRYGAHELGTALDHRLALDFTDPKLSWADLLARHEKWLELFANHHWQKGVVKRRDDIASHLQEVRRREQLPRIDKPSPADLVFELHDEFHADLSNLYWDAGGVACPEPTPQGMRPTDRLLELDLEAVPALIDALSDQGPTRTVLYSGRHGGHFSVETVSALAQCTLIEIAGSRPQGQGDAGWREWYARAQKEGIRRLAEEGVASLDPTAIRMFLRRWPKDLDFVLTAMRKAGPDAVTASHFEQMLASSKGPPDERVLTWCVDCVRQAKDWSQQLFMAKVLLDHDHTGGVGPLLAQWRKRVAQEKKPRPDPRVDYQAYEEWSREAGARDELLGFLVGAGDLAVWRAIAEECARPDVRMSLGWRLLQIEWSTARRRVKESELAEVEAAFRKCLTLLLADDATLGSGVSFSHRASTVYLHRACCADVAACVLAANWPKEFAFDPACTETVRRRQILALRGTPLPRQATSAPSETPAEAMLRANRVERVVIDKSAESLDAAALERVRAMKGKPLTAEGLLELVTAAAAKAKPNGVICTCERTGEGDGTSLTIACRPLFEGGVDSVSSGPGGSGGWDVLLLVTARGAQLGDERLGVTSGTLEKAEKLGEYGNYLGAIRKALQSEAGNGVEITFGVQLH